MKARCNQQSRDSSIAASFFLCADQILPKLEQFSHLHHRKYSGWRIRNPFIILELKLTKCIYWINEFWYLSSINTLPEQRRIFAAATKTKHGRRAPLISSAAKVRRARTSKEFVSPLVVMPWLIIAFEINAGNQIHNLSSKQWKLVMIVLESMRNFSDLLICKKIIRRTRANDSFKQKIRLA